MKTGLVVEGGGMRGIYSAGVLDAFMDLDLTFDYAIGASAGAANLVSYQAHQYKRTYRFYHEYGNEKQFLSLENYLRHHQYFGLDYIYDVISVSSGKDPVDYQTLMKNPAQLELVATDARTSRAHYFQKQEMPQNQYDILKASCSIPAVNHPIVIDGVPYYDGGVADPIPVQRAFDQGCDLVVVVLCQTWPRQMEPKHDGPFFEHALKDYPRLFQQIQRCDELHLLQDELAFAYQKAGRAIVIMPAHDEAVASTTRDKKALDDFYWQGYHDAESMQDLLKERLCR